MYATFDMDFRSVTLDGYVDLAQLLRIVRIRDLSFQITLEGSPSSNW